jgi:pyruvate,water dikinase
MQINPAASIENLGGKGFQLYLLDKFCPVPEFFIVRFDSLNEIDSIAAQNEILNNFDDRAFSTVSVRSSATVEDSKTASFAGIFESKLNVSREGLIDAVRDVLTSLKDVRVAEYCSLNNQRNDLIEMRVVIQKMVNSRVSGVCITRERKDSETLLIEACLGLGEPLVSGLVSPDTYKVDRRTLEVISSTIGFQKVMLLAGNVEIPTPVPFFQRNAKKLQNDELSELGRLFISIEDKLGYESADIEWAYDESSLHVLQVRPFIGLY